ncbi:uncharacterized protein [Spinacia oleracea]|uniref:Uncharacterized protein isoform X1 n=1 Tax=Spinacia oleracea TaxID=3562 RepID=A0ABM3RBB7_SPIOL|nr:uncharacterized protein LOC110774919 isoform X1 [Spinacia oleracea]XP_056692910.1 uncharacterized protein LOC110774919 isoform X1 [Spinacia oleracea]XP_056692911.1 uncharacterized protein LOC110774919 isoform X1 [Spinacia oleracea]
METLSHMILNLEAKKEITGIKVSRDAPPISHLFFADDSLFCFRAFPDSCQKIKDTIKFFCEISGEMINYDKSAVMFSPNTPTTFKHIMRKILGTPSTEKLGKYLGCNVEIDGRSSQVFHQLVEKVQRKITSWKNLALSQAGRLLLTNGILAALCANVLSVFLAPTLVKKKIDSILCRYWWKGSSETKGICWRKRSLLEIPKERGGVGLRSVLRFNTALLVKYAHRIHNNNELLISKVYNAKYKGTPVEHGISGKQCNTASWGFKGLVRSVAKCREGFGKVIGRGNRIAIGDDNWLPSGKPSFKSELDAATLGTKKVEDLMIPGSRVWNSNLIWRSFDQESARAILSTHIPTQVGEDKLLWAGTESGAATAKSVYAYLGSQLEEGLGSTANVMFWKKLWGMPCLPKWKVFVWKILNKALALNANLCRRGVMVCQECHLCGKEVENESHLFRDCSVSKHIWYATDFGIRP